MKKNNLGYFMVFCMIVCAQWHLLAKSDNRILYRGNDSLVIVSDTVKTGFWTDFINRQNHSENPLFLVRMNIKGGLPIINNEYKGFGSDLYEVSSKFIIKYYSKRIPLFNYNNQGFVFLSLKDAQNSLGILQFRIPFGNLRLLFHPKKWKK